MKPPSAFVFPDNLAALAAARELGSAGIRVFVGGPRRGPAGRSRFVTFLQMPDLYKSTAQWAEAVCAWGSLQSSPPVLFASEDAALLAAEKHHEELARVFIKPYPAPGVIDRIIDKRRLYEAAERSHVAVPRSREIRDPAEAAGIKPNGWLVKPALRYRLTSSGGVESFRQATGATKAIGGDPETASREVLAGGFPAILQEAVPGGFENLITVALTVGRDGRLLDFFAACKKHEYPEPFGDGLIVRIVQDPGLLSSCVRLLGEVGYWGICDIEFKRDPASGDYKLLDANPRTWLWLTLGCRSGHHLLLLAYNEATGQQIRPALAATRTRAWVSPRGSVAFLARCYRPSRHGLALPPRLVIGALLTAFGNWRSFRDPLYVRPSAWPEVFAASSRLLRQGRKRLIGRTRA
ncbi:MAG: hypothetical protein HY899_18185 [Deltaproteobacteria bacterium]|nr:hypothetical protein [Deltaproteobacteria bacterium]